MTYFNFWMRGDVSTLTDNDTGNGDGTVILHGVTHRDRMRFEYSFVFLMSSKFEERTVEFRKSFRGHPSMWV